LNDLEFDFAQCPIIRSDPVVTYKETMTEVADQMAMTKSQNKHNRIHANGGPLHQDLAELIEKDEISATQDIKARGKRLAE